MKKAASLFDIGVGETALVRGLSTSGAMRRRMQDLGLIEGTRVECLQKSPAGDPVAYLVRGAVIALRSEDASSVLVVPTVL